MQISKTVFSNVLKKVVTFIPKVKSSDSSGVVLLSPKDGQIVLTLSYPEATIQSVVGALADAEEAALRFHGPKLLSIVMAADKEIVLKEEDGLAVVRSGSSLWKEPMPIASQSSIELPESEICEVDTYGLLTAFNTVKYAIDSDSVRPSLYMVDVVDGRVRACNGYQYHEASTRTKGLTFSIPGGMVDSFSSVLRFFDGPTKFYSDDDNYYFTNGNDSLAIHKLSANFPDLDRLLVRPLKTDVLALLLIDKNDLVKAVKRVSLVLDDSYPYVELHINKSEVIVRGTQKSGAESVSSVPASWATKPRVATFNFRYLLRTLNSLNDGQVELRFGADTKSKKSPMVSEGTGTWMMLNQSNLSARA